MTETSYAQRKKAVVPALLASAFAFGATAAVAANCPEGFPGEPVNFWVGYDAGGGTDLIARSLASQIEQAQDWTVVVTNMPGAGSSVMMTRLADSGADGLTIGLTSTGSVTKVPNRNPDSAYSIEDFTFLGTAQETPVVIAVLADAGFDDYEGMIEHAREEGRLMVATGATDTNIFFDDIAEREDVRIIIIPSKGTAGAMQQLLGGHVDAALVGSTVVDHMKAGKVNTVMAMGSQKPPFAPEAETAPELGYDFIGATSYVLIAAPDGLEPEVETCLEQVIDEAVNSEQFAEFQMRLNNQAFNLGPEDVTEMLERDFAVFRDYYGNQSE